MKKSGFIVTFLIGIVILLSVTKVVAYNRLSTSGVFVGKVEEEISAYKTQNAILSEKLFTSSSLTNIADKAAEAGFTKEGSSLMVLGTSRPLAVRQ
ncbi:MAG: hypothetical protein Q7R51_02040 [bacterium]|nr:hypothetical protein [bacterium]